MAGGRTVGPFSRPQIKERLDSGEINDETLCAAAGDSQRLPVRNLPGPTAISQAAAVSSAAAPQPQADLDALIVQTLSREGKIAAIKLYRDYNLSAGLADAQPTRVVIS